MAELLTNSNNLRPDGFPPGLWVAITRQPTTYTTRELAAYPHMFNLAHREQDVVKMYNQDGSIRVTGISADFLNCMKRE